VTVPLVHGRINSQLGIIQNSSTERAFFSFAPKQVRMFPAIYCFLIFQAGANISHNLIVSRLSGKTFGEGDSDALKVYVGRGTIASGYTPMENVVVRVQAHAKDGNIFGRLPLTQRRWREYLRHTTNPPQMNSKGLECFREIINPLHCLFCRHSTMIQGSWQSEDRHSNQRLPPFKLTIAVIPIPGLLQFKFEDHHA